ncbi:MAG: 4Fe-4S cluster-binding domain-containing protein [Paludibacteraceae bacterium]
MKNKLFIPPTALSIITTYKCSAKCHDCCFACSPKRNEKLLLREIKKYVDDATDSYPTIKIVILTGGESFLLKNNLIKIVEHIAKKGLFTRIITNGYWASNYEIAKEKLIPLVKSGLSEINFSTGDDHIEFVPFERVKNGAMAALDLRITTLINVESGSDRKFNYELITKDETLVNYIFPNKKENPLGIINGLWMPFTEKSMNKSNDIDYNNCAKNELNKGKCTNLFNTKTITPEHRMVACCGLPSIYIKYIDLGNTQKFPIKKLYDAQFEDF